VIFMAFALTTGVGIYFSAITHSGSPAAIRAASGPAVRLATAG